MFRWTWDCLSSLSAQEQILIECQGSGAGGSMVYPVDQGTVSIIVEVGEGREGGVDGLPAKVPNHLECNDTRQDRCLPETDWFSL